jgi:hypothetical protein
LAVDLSPTAEAGPSTLSADRKQSRPRKSGSGWSTRKLGKAARKSIQIPTSDILQPPALAVAGLVAPNPPPAHLPPIPPFPVLKAELYDLPNDMIYKHISPLSEPVMVPGYEIGFQPAYDVPGDFYPHNAENLGLVRWVPTPDQSPEPFRKGLVKGRSGVRSGAVLWYAFMYT